MRRSTISFLLLVLHLTLLTNCGATETFLTRLGRIVRLDHVRHHIPSATQAHLSHVLFEHTPEGELLNHYSYLRIPDIAPHRALVGVDHQEVHKLHGKPLKDPVEGPFIRMGGGFTFLYDVHSQELIAAWGPGLSLHPLDPRRYPGVFLNRAGLHRYEQDGFISSPGQSGSNIFKRVERNIREGREVLQKHQRMGNDLLNPYLIAVSRQANTTSQSADPSTSSDEPESFTPSDPSMSPTPLQPSTLPTSSSASSSSAPSRKGNPTNPLNSSSTSTPSVSYSLSVPATPSTPSVSFTQDSASTTIVSSTASKAPTPSLPSAVPTTAPDSTTPSQPSLPNQQSQPLQEAPKPTCPPSEVVHFEMALVYDLSFCALYGRNHTIATQVVKGMIEDIRSQFADNTCARIQRRPVDAYCNSRDDPFKRPRTLRRCARGKCDSSRIMLKHIRDEYEKTTSAFAPRDGVFFFSGYEDSTNVLGAAFKSAACDESFSYAWIEKDHATVLAHEVGHMLGAPHSSDGLMRNRIDPLKSLRLSPDSIFYINKFIIEDPRSWCLHRDFTVFPRLRQEYHWSYPTDFMQNRGGTNMVEDIVFGDLFGNGLSDLLVLQSDRVSSDIVLSLSVVKQIVCKPLGFCDYSAANGKKSLAIKVGSDERFFGVAYGNIRNASSPDLIVSSIHYGANRIVAFYRVGYNINGGAEIEGTWSELKKVGSFNSSNVQCSAVALGNVRSAGSKDIIFAHVYTERDRNVVQYTIGYEMDQNGNVTGGWSEPRNVYGWYGKETTGVSVSLYDIDGNGKPELILSHVDNSSSVRSGFYRIGRDLNEDGIIEGGWTDDVQLPDLFGAVSSLRGSVAVSGAGTGAPTFAYMDRQADPTGVQYWKLYTGTGLLTKKLLDTSTTRREREDLSFGCSECYNGNHAARCSRAMRLCSSTIDEVRLETNVLGGKNGTTTTVAETSVRMNQRLPRRPTKNSFYCVGFHFMYVNNEYCNVFDKEVVVSKGVEEFFHRAVRNEIPLDDSEYESTSLLEHPSGSGGVSGADRLPQPGKVIITSKHLTRKAVLRRAVRKLTRVLDYHHVFEKRTAKIERKNRYTWVVLFRFKDLKEYPAATSRK